QAETILSRAIFVLPLALLLSIRSALRAPLPAPRLFLLWWTALVFAATCVQVRFQSSLAPALALLLAWWIDRALAWSSTGERRLWKGVATGVLLLGVFQPWAGFYSRGLGNQLRWLRGEEPIVRPLDARRHLLVEVAEWIRENTPPTSGYLDAEAKPEYAVLSSWTDGHILGYVARRPTVTNNFGDDIGVENPVRADRYYVAEEDAASDILDDLRARYVLLEYRPTRPRRNFGPRSMLSRLYFSDGAAGERATVSREGELREIEHEASAVTRHRLVFESRPKPFLRGERPGFKLYEHVAGARLEGRAPAGARVEARLPIETNRGRRFEFVTHTRADDRGHYALAVPYASGASGTSGDAAARGGAVRSLDRYAVSAAGRSASVAVSEAAVREGLAVPGPDLRSLPSG
ncbi:MAG: hypothetical protein O7A09_12625, partial [Proteobacteria bacterium]|nr:hypothetical protein [Pseudomonadota bacterium]